MNFFFCSPLRSAATFIAGTMLLAASANTAEIKHFPAAQAPNGAKPAFSSSVLAGNTLYVSGAIDRDPATGKPGATPEEAAKLVLDSVKNSVEAAGFTMDELVWVQVFCADLSNYQTFNDVYRTYFHGELPARAFLGVDHLLNNAHFEVMGIAVRKAP